MFFKMYCLIFNDCQGQMLFFIFYEAVKKCRQLIGLIGRVPRLTEDSSAADNSSPGGDELRFTRSKPAPVPGGTG